MRTPYNKILALSVSITALLFAIDKNTYTWTWQSIAGYLLVGLIYVIVISLILSSAYIITKFIRGKLKGI